MPTYSRPGALVGVDPELADYIQQAAGIVARAAPGVTLEVVSGYRSQSHQADLRARWDRGDRTGLVVRPAASSRHTQGRAVDVSFAYLGQRVPVRATPMSWWVALAELLSPVGVRWGGRFRTRDVNHFEV
jgi:D-alanyl-D-alanine dipeptidase